MGARKRTQWLGGLKLHRKTRTMTFKLVQCFSVFVETLSRVRSNSRQWLRMHKPSLDCSRAPACCAGVHNWNCLLAASPLSLGKGQHFNLPYLQWADPFQFHCHSSLGRPHFFTMAVWLCLSIQVLQLHKEEVVSAWKHHGSSQAL